MLIIFNHYNLLVLDYAVRGEGQLVDICKLSSKELAILYDQSEPKMKWRYIPYILVPHPPIIENPSRLYAIHLWSGQTMLERYNYASKNGFWSKSIPSITSLHFNHTDYINTNHFKLWLEYLGYNFNTSRCTLIY